jgi:tRNA(His) guanylyltransferase
VCVLSSSFIRKYCISVIFCYISSSSYIYHLTMSHISTKKRKINSSNTDDNSTNTVTVPVVGAAAAAADPDAKMQRIATPNNAKADAKAAKDAAFWHIARANETKDFELDDTLGDRIKALEKAWEGPTLDPSKPFVVRLDGQTFTGFTKGFEKPMDPRIARAMVLATVDLVQTFKACCGYVASDEATLLFRSQDILSGPKAQLHPYGGRVMKLTSLMASKMSVRFNQHIANEIKDDPKLLHKIGTAIFDCRIFQVDSDAAASDGVWWRHRYDSFRNGVNNLAHYKLKGWRMQHVPLRRVITKLGENGIHINAQPDHMFFGTLIKKEVYDKVGYNPKTQQSVICSRTRVTCRIARFLRYLTAEQRVNAMMTKEWPRHLLEKLEAEYDVSTVGARVDFAP